MHLQVLAITCLRACISVAVFGVREEDSGGGLGLTEGHRLEKDDLLRVRLVDGAWYLSVLLHEHLRDNVVWRVILVSLRIRRLLHSHQLRLLVAYSSLLAVGRERLANCFAPRFGISIK